MNNIFIISNNLKRLEIFFNYYNIFNKPTDIKLNIILDNRTQDFDVSLFKEKYNIYYTKDIIKKIKPFFEYKPISNFFDNTDALTLMLKEYPVSIKWFVFPFIHKVLKIERAMMIDDDTLLLKPLDHYFDYSYVYYNEGVLGSMSPKIERLLKPLYNDIIDISTLRDKSFSLNSGQIIHTDNLMLYKFINKILDERVINFLINEKSNYKKSKRSLIRPFGGKTWILEQNMFAIYYKWLEDNGYPIMKFKSDVKILTSTIKEKRKIIKLPSFVHYLPGDKTPFYKFYVEQVEDYVSK